MAVLTKEDIGHFIIPPKQEKTKRKSDWKNYVLPGRGKREDIAGNIDTLVYDLKK